MYYWCLTLSKYVIQAKHSYFIVFVNLVQQWVNSQQREVATRSLGSSRISVSAANVAVSAFWKVGKSEIRSRYMSGLNALPQERKTSNKFVRLWKSENSAVIGKIEGKCG